MTLVSSTKRVAVKFSSKKQRIMGVIWPIGSQCWYLVPTSRLLLKWRFTVMGYNSCPDSQSERWDSHFHQLQSTEKPISDSSSQLRWHMDPHFVIGGSLSADFLGTNFAFFTTKKIGIFWNFKFFSSINITNLLKFLGKIHQIFSITKLKIKNPGTHFRIVVWTSGYVFVDEMTLRGCFMLMVHGYKVNRLWITSVIHLYILDEVRVRVQTRKWRDGGRQRKHSTREH